MATHGPNGLIRQDWAMETAVLRVDTSNRWLADLTADATAFCRERGDGLLHVFAPHATAGLALIELGSGTEDDLAEVLTRLLPRDDRYRHRHGATGHGADHVLPAIVSPSLSIPVLHGRMALGTWQSLVLVDSNVDNPERQVRLSFVGA
jgi:secondary thiamine-phosphate synthase enzyme